jgi:hypothetical protein
VKPLKKRPLKLAPARLLPEGGKYLHFGLESALKGSSIGIIHKNALIFQCISIYNENPKLLPLSIRKKVNIFVH